MKLKVINIDHDDHLCKDVKKVKFENDELPKIQLFNSDDVIIGNYSSPIAICFAYTWKEDYPPKEIKEFAQKISNYASLTGFWRTTNGGRYAFSNILSNPNINKIIVLVFNAKDNGHLLADSMINLWQNGVDEKGVIIGSKAPNPKFEQVPIEGLNRVKKQCDLLVMRNLTQDKKSFDKVEEIITACIQEPKNAKNKKDFSNVEYYSDYRVDGLIYDDGARFESHFIIDLSSSARKVVFEEKSFVTSVGSSIQAKNLSDAIEQVASHIFKNGSSFYDERGILNIESRSFTLTVIDPLEKIPENFDESYITRYVDEFMNGKGENLDEFAYTYHNRIFKKWGNQVEKSIDMLKKSPNTRRCLISLWDQTIDLQNPNAPCLDFIWFVIRNDSIELHATYRSHHLATITEDGKLMRGEGALVPNLYALGTLQKYVSEKIGKKRGPLILNDYSGHLYVSKI